MRMALAESRNAVAIWLARWVGLKKVIDAARDLGIKTPLQPYIATALGASEVRLLELANAYRALASGIITDAHVIEKVVDSSGKPIYQAPRASARGPPPRRAGPDPGRLARSDPSASTGRPTRSTPPTSRSR